MVEKPWGRTDLPPPFTAPTGQRIGEIWFDPPPECAGLLVKYLFTDEKLSVQVHPSGAQAIGNETGKDECWLVLAAAPDARIAIGLHEETDARTLEAAARDGSIERLLDWHEVEAGDFFYLPAGTIHAIGGGITLIEVQQNSDTTFRLFDHGRGRTLQLERALAVAQCGPLAPEHRRKLDMSSQCLVHGPHFRLDRVVGMPPPALAADYPGALLALPLAGELMLGRERLQAGECGFAPALDQFDFTRAEDTLLARLA